MIAYFFFIYFKEYDNFSELDVKDAEIDDSDELVTGCVYLMILWYHPFNELTALTPSKTNNLLNVLFYRVKYCCNGYLPDKVERSAAQKKV